MREKKKRNPVKKLDTRMRRKLLALFVVIVAAFVCLLSRITYINAVSGDKYKKQVLSQAQQQYDSRVLPFKRGDILDRNGTVLASSSKVYNVIMDCKVINSDEKYLGPTVQAMVSLLGINEEEVRNVLSAEDTRSSQYYILEKGLDMDKKKAFEEYTDTSQDSGLSEEEIEARSNIVGVWFEEEYKRNYPLGSLACDTIGFTLDDGNADWGLEGYYNSTLTGVEIWLFQQRFHRGAEHHTAHGRQDDQDYDRCGDPADRREIYTGVHAGHGFRGAGSDPHGSGQWGSPGPGHPGFLRPQ